MYDITAQNRLPFNGAVETREGELVDLIHQLSFLNSQGLKV